MEADDAMAARTIGGRSILKKGNYDVDVVDLCCLMTFSFWGFEQDI